MRSPYCKRTTTAIIMRKDEFAKLQHCHQKSGKTLKEFLDEMRIPVDEICVRLSTSRKKMLCFLSNFFFRNVYKTEILMTSR